MLPENLICVLRRFALAGLTCTVAFVATPATANNTTLPTATPMTGVGPQPPKLDMSRIPRNALVHWKGEFSDLAKYKNVFWMVGTNPAKSNATTTVPVYIIPIVMVYGPDNGNTTFDPTTHKVSDGKTVIGNIKASPIFNGSLDWNEGGTDLGQTQYVDAFQRGNFWSFVSSNPGYHVLLGKPTVLDKKTIEVTPDQGKVTVEYGVTVGTMNYVAFNNYLKKIMKGFTQINPGVLPIFVTYNVYLTQQGQCCTGGYHSALPNYQTYSYSTYIDTIGVFGEDVSVLSHEIAEWMDDPFISNSVPCASTLLTPPFAMEVGDPLVDVHENFVYPYTLNNFTYHLQDLAFLGYFGATDVTSVNGWLSFHKEDLPNACSPSFATFDVQKSPYPAPEGINDAVSIVGIYVDSNLVDHGFLRFGNGQITNIDPPGSLNTVALDINDYGAITGWYSSNTSEYNGFVRIYNGKPMTFNVPGAAGTVAIAINATGVIKGIGSIAGNYEDNNLAFHGFLRAPDGTFTTFDPPGAGKGTSQGTRSAGINAQGSITGWYLDSGNIEHGFLRTSDGTITPFDAPNAYFTISTSVNDSDTVAGYFRDGNGNYYSFVRAADGTITTFNISGSNQSFANSINDRGSIVGSYSGGSFVRAADGTITTFNPLGSSRSDSGRINANGVITGTYTDSNGVPHAFVGVP